MVERSLLPRCMVWQMDEPRMVGITQGPDFSLFVEAVFLYLLPVPLSERW